MGMREDLRIPLTMLSISFLNELPFKGSYNGKRFMFKKNVVKDENGVEIKDKSNLTVWVWKDLYNFENTKDEEKQYKEFEYSKEGIDKGIDFVEESIV